MARRSSFWWALHTEHSGRWFSEAGSQGLEWAVRLALGEVASVKELAAEQGVSESTARRRLDLARAEGWPGLSDEGIRSQIRRPKPTRRRCDDCNDWVPDRPRSARGRRPSYCDDCSTPKARKRRSRRRAV